MFELGAVAWWLHSPSPQLHADLILSGWPSTHLSSPPPHPPPPPLPSRSSPVSRSTNILHQHPITNGSQRDLLENGRQQRRRFPREPRLLQQPAPGAPPDGFLQAAHPTCPHLPNLSVLPPTQTNDRKFPSSYWSVLQRRAPEFKLCIMQRAE